MAELSPPGLPPPMLTFMDFEFFSTSRSASKNCHKGTKISATSAACSEPSEQATSCFSRPLVRSFSCKASGFATTSGQNTPTLESFVQVCLGQNETSRAQQQTLISLSTSILDGLLCSCTNASSMHELRKIPYMRTRRSRIPSWGGTSYPKCRISMFMRPFSHMSYGQYFWYAQNTGILQKDFSKAHNGIPIRTPRFTHL